VLASVPEARPIERAEPMPLSQPVAAATGGFLAGLAALVLVRAVRGGGGRSLLRLGRRRRMRGLEVTGSRSFLVDVHMIKR
jgi:hypothetical protein